MVSEIVRWIQCCDCDSFFAGKFEDDPYNHEPVMQFWKDFKREQGIVEELNQIDSGGGWFRKRKAIKVDFSFFRKPQDANIKVAVSQSFSGFGRKQGLAVKLKDSTQ